MTFTQNIYVLYLITKKFHASYGFVVDTSICSGQYSWSWSLVLMRIIKDSHKTMCVENYRGFSINSFQSLMVTDNSLILHIYIIISEHYHTYLLLIHTFIKKKKKSIYFICGFGIMLNK
jgi:hypothetical protein